MEASNLFKDGRQDSSKEKLWYVDNYVLLKDYYDRTISRIAARCVRQGNIAMEEYPFYGYILDVLEEISETGDFIIEHQELYPYVEKKIAGGINALKKNLNEFKQELKNNASPDMIKQDKDELNKIKEALGSMDKSKDPTAGAGMSMDEVIDKLMQKQDNGSQPQQNQGNHANEPQMQRPSNQQQNNGANQQRPAPAQQNQPNRSAPNINQQRPPQGQQNQPNRTPGNTPGTPFNNGEK